jgi:hypothetical protein
LAISIPATTINVRFLTIQNRLISFWIYILRENRLLAGPVLIF